MWDIQKATFFILQESTDELICVNSEIEDGG